MKEDSIEHLNILRYKVIADWPDMLERFSVGYIFEHPYGRQYLTAESKYDPADFPHLFKELHWSDDRKPEDMPLYVKNKDGVVLDLSVAMPKAVAMRVVDSFLHASFPATAEEYQSYINNNKSI